jgi:hypothetical protein
LQALFAAAAAAAAEAAAAAAAEAAPLQALFAAADVEAAHELEFTLWDLAGQAVYRASHQSTFSAHALYTCAVDATDDAETAAAKVLGWYDYLQDSVQGALFRLLLTHIDMVADWRAKGAALQARLHAHEAARRAALEQQFARHPDAQLKRLLTLPELQVQLQPADEVWGISNHTGECAPELRARLVATALDKALMPLVGAERPKLWIEVERLCLTAGAPHLPRDELRRRAAALVKEEESFTDALAFWHAGGRASSRIE